MIKFSGTSQVRTGTGGKNVFPCLSNRRQDWQPYPVDTNYAVCDDQTKSILISPSSEVVGIIPLVKPLQAL